MSRINWARTSRMNWVYDNMGGSKVYEPILGVLSGHTALVEADGTVIIETPAPGGGLVAFVRGVWLAATTFSYTGFWANAEGGDLTNYFTGGSYANVGAQTIITLGSALTPGDSVQVYYFYDLETPTAKGEAVNNFPCPRKAYRSATDFTYDYAVDRIFDLMGILHAAGLVRGIDYTRYWEFLWRKYVEHAASLENPLFLDDFERSLVGTGRYLLYNNSDQGQAGFDIFEIQLYPGDDANPVTGLTKPRALRVVLPSFAASWHGAWWGYGLNWDLSNTPLDTVDTLTFKLRTARNACSIQNLYRGGFAGGQANLIVRDQGGGASPQNILIWIDGGGALETATYKWSLDEGATWEATGLTTCDLSSPAHLFDNIYIWWETYGTPNFAVGDFWIFRTLDAFVYPQRLLAVLNDSLTTDPTPWTEEHSFYHALPDNYETLTEVALAFTQFWRRDNIVYDGDRRKGTGWGSWYSTPGPTDCTIIVTERELKQTFASEIFYTQLKVEFVAGSSTAWGAWTGLDTSEVNSTGRTGINLAVYPEATGIGTVAIRLKVKDAAGSYFYKDFTPTKNQWNRLTTSFASMTLESGSAPMVHPVALVEIGQASSPTANAIFYITDIKYDDHIVFAGPNLRTLEFKYEENFLALAPPAYWLDDVSLNLEAADPYPWAPRVALSLGPNGLNPYRGPSLVHYAQPLAPHLMNLATETATFVAMHAGAQDAFNAAYGGTKGPIKPVHTRNDIENIALLGSANFHTFSWWPDYPEAASGLGQYWAFMRLAHYYFVSHDNTAKNVLDNWVTWFEENIVADGLGWKIPTNFNNDGTFNYGAYDPGQTAAIIIGLLYLYMTTGEILPDKWITLLLQDLRLKRQSIEYAYLYKSDLHYGWLNALVAHAFGLAVAGRPGSSFVYAFNYSDKDHFEAMLNQFFAMAGDSKPNVLNADLLPFSLVENGDSWAFAPNYMMNKEYGSTEALILMMNVATDLAIIQLRNTETGEGYFAEEYFEEGYFGEYSAGTEKAAWQWFDTMLRFLIFDNLTILSASNIESITGIIDKSRVANKARVLFGNFMQDNDYYAEKEDAVLVALQGENSVEVDLRYGNPVITESMAMATLLAERTLASLSKPNEQIEVTTWLEGIRAIVGETLNPISAFHGYDTDEFFLIGKTINLDKKRTILRAIRQIEWKP